MKLKSYYGLLCLSVFFLIWWLDYFLKSQALIHLKEVHEIGPFFFKLVFNKGMIFSSFRDASDFILQIGLTTMGALLVFVYFFIYMFIGPYSKTLGLGVSLIASGIIGNITDRILYRKVIDFMWIDFGFSTTGIFNLADFVQWVGYVLFLVGIYKRRDIFWPSEDFRAFDWINKKFQMRYIMSFILFNLSFALVSGACFLSFLIFFSKTNTSIVESSFFTQFLVIYSIISLQFCVLISYITYILSHRIVGPIYAFDKYINKLEREGSRVPFEIRKTDEFFDFKKMASKINRLMKKK